MNTALRFFAVLLVFGALVSGQFPGSESRCACLTGAAFAQAQEPGLASPAIPATPATGVETASAGAVPSAGQSTDQGSSTAVASPAPALTISGPLPRLVDLGADKCIPCKKMAPILEEAEKLYKGLATVEFIDVWKNRDAGAKYGIRTIPTQIFFDASGTEVLRHEGFFPMEEIQKQFKAMGVELKKE